VPSWLRHLNAWPKNAGERAEDFPGSSLFDPRNFTPLKFIETSYQTLPDIDYIHQNFVLECVFKTDTKTALSLIIRILPSTYGNLRYLPDVMLIKTAILPLMVTGSHWYSRSAVENFKG
jgi:hypothetical protein